MTAKLITALTEQHALINLQVARAADPNEVSVTARCRHVMRAVYAHLAAFKAHVISAVGECEEVGRLKAAMEVMAAALTVMAVADGSGTREGLAAVGLALSPLIGAERNVLAKLATRPASEVESLAAAVEEHFEALYGRDELARAEWAVTRQ